MFHCVQATKTVTECQTFRTKRYGGAFCAPAEITQEVCVVTEQYPGSAQLKEWMNAALEQWRKVSRVERPMIMAPRYHCESYQYAITPAGLSALTIEDKCSWVKSVLNYFFI